MHLVVDAFTVLGVEESTTLEVVFVVIGQVWDVESLTVTSVASTPDVVQTHICDWHKIMRRVAILQVPRSIQTIREVGHITSNFIVCHRCFRYVRSSGLTILVVGWGWI